jgi:hypothetical protein
MVQVHSQCRGGLAHGGTSWLHMLLLALAASVQCRRERCAAGYKAAASTRWQPCGEAGRPAHAPVTDGGPSRSLIPDNIGEIISEAKQ